MRGTGRHSRRSCSARPIYRRARPLMRAHKIKRRIWLYLVHDEPTFRVGPIDGWFALRPDRNALRIGRACAHTHVLSGMVSATERRNHSSIPLAAGVASRFRDCADKGPIRPASASATGVPRPGATMMSRCTADWIYSISVSSVAMVKVRLISSSPRFARSRRRCVRPQTASVRTPRLASGHALGPATAKWALTYYTEQAALLYSQSASFRAQPCL